MYNIYRRRKEKKVQSWSLQKKTGPKEILEDGFLKEMSSSSTLTYSTFDEKG